MIIACPACHARYRINPGPGNKAQARVKCPGCQHTFDITFAADALLPPPPPEPAAEAATQPLVLVVDDARFFREMICDLLAELPIRLDTAGDGQEALQKILASRPALLLVDLNIPGMSGGELIAAVRREPACRKMRILAMSSVQRGEETASDMRRLGADDFINKSFKPRDLQQRVRKILEL